MIVVACNTASAIAFNDVKKSVGKAIAVNVIDPVVDHTKSKTKLWNYWDKKHYTIKSLRH